MKLSDASKHLISILMNDCGLHYEKQTKQTTLFLKTFYKYFKEADKYVGRLKLEHKVITIDKKIPKSDDFDYIIEPIRAHIINMSKYYINYKLTMLSKNLDITFIFDEATSLSDLKNNIYKILLWLYVVINISKDKSCSSSKLKIFVYFTVLMKKLPEHKREQIGKVNVNTGYTQACSKESNIVIYRKEEWFKVFVHETLHNLGLDFSHVYDSKRCNEIILGIFPVKSKVNLYEAYTDTCAKMIHAMFCGYVLTDNEKEYMEASDFLITCERTHIFFQVIKILDFMGLTYDNLHVKDPENSKLRDTLYYEHTNVLSYYIINSILFNNYQDFIVWCKKHNDKYIQFDNSYILNQIKFCKYIEENYNTSKMKKKIKTMTTYYRSKRSGDYFMSNMRKSICELD